MKNITLTLTLLLLGAGGIGNAWADRGHVHGHFGVTIGPVWGWPWHYPRSPYYYSPYYPPPVIIERAEPQVYIEQPAAMPAPPASVAPAPENYWYYCATAKGYYPYVKACPGGWRRVLPQPPDQR
jgi:hypothetical protein